MSKTGGSRDLFPSDKDMPPNVVGLRKAGILPHSQLRWMALAGGIKAPDLEADQFQPASLDLRLGKRAYRVRASFLPGPTATVMERVGQLDGLPAIDIEKGAVLEPGAVYVVELLEAVALNADITGVANPKSSTGRLDILTRLITDYATAFDRIEKGYEGPLYLEVSPLTFSVIVRHGVRLNQVRFQRGVGALTATDAQKYYERGQLIGSEEELLPLRDNVLVPVTIDLQGNGRGSTVGYKAKKYANKIDVGLVDYYDPRDFWDRIEATDGRLHLDKGDFYILATREDVGVPPQLAAEMVPYDTRSGEFRVHYAGFFDPGFGWEKGKAEGSKAVLEVRTHGVPFTLEHGQIVGWLRYSPISGGFADMLYGRDIKSNYQGQGVTLAKQFKRWPI